MRKRTYVTKGVWHLRKGQRRSFFPLSGPFLVAAAGPVIDRVAAPLIKGVVRKIVGHGKRRRGRQRYRRKRF